MMRSVMFALATLAAASLGSASTASAMGHGGGGGHASFGHAMGGGPSPASITSGPPVITSRSITGSCITGSSSSARHTTMDTTMAMTPVTPAYGPLGAGGWCRSATETESLPMQHASGG